MGTAALRAAARRLEPITFSDGHGVRVRMLVTAGPPRWDHTFAGQWLETWRLLRLPLLGVATLSCVRFAVVLTPVLNTAHSVLKRICISKVSSYSIIQIDGLAIKDVIRPLTGAQKL